MLLPWELQTTVPCRGGANGCNLCILVLAAGLGGASPIARVLAEFKVQAPISSDALRCFRDVFVDVLVVHVVRSSLDLFVVAFGIR